MTGVCLGGLCPESVSSHSSFPHLPDEWVLQTHTISVGYDLYIHWCNLFLGELQLLPTETAEGDVFRSVCQSTGVGGLPLKGGAASKGGSAYRAGGSASGGGGCLPAGVRLRKPWYWHLVAATTAVGTYPAGTHSCSRYIWILWLPGERNQF